MSEEEVVEFPTGINFDQVIKDLNGADVPYRAEEGTVVPLKLGDACVQALMASAEGDKADGIQKLKRYNLAQKLQGSSDSEIFPTLRLNSKQKKLIEDQSALAWNTLIYGRIYEALEGPSQDDDE